MISTWNGILEICFEIVAILDEIVSAAEGCPLPSQSRPMACPLGLDQHREHQPTVLGVGGRDVVGGSPED
jgi:hypothetical protein